MPKTGEQHYQDYQKYLSESKIQSAGLSLMTAAICGYCPAQAELGYKYLHGILFPKDYEQAMRWLTAAADQGDAASMTNLATMYMYGTGAQTNGKKGIGFPKSEKDALPWYRKGVEMGDMGAAILLGDCYENGRGVKKDLEEARRLYELAAAGDGEEAETAREALESMKRI